MVEFSLSKYDARENEAPNAMMRFEIAKDGILLGLLANPVLLRVTPLTVTDANILNFTRPADDDVSPSVAGKVQQVVHTAFDSLIFAQIKMTSMPLLLM